jgi:asparagine synthase (glutamine-hydrolysing)
MVEEHEAGRFDHSTPLWSMLMFDAFLRGTMGQVASKAAA